MTASRLNYLLSQDGSGGDLELPVDGRVAVWCPQAGQDLTPLAADCVDIITGFYPDYQWFAARGYTALTAPNGRYSASIVCLPREKDAARHITALALSVTDGPIIVDGAKTDGIESFYKTCRKLGDVSPAVSKSHGKIFWFKTLNDVNDWRGQNHEAAPGFITRPGVFSADGIDPASEWLAQNLPARLGPHVVDLGAGWGYLSAAALKASEQITQIDLVEANHDALACARDNVSDPRAKFHWADATTWHPAAAVDSVIMNPPFHKGRDADPKLGQTFIRAAGAMLKPAGSLWMVANRHLPYETTLAEIFRDVDEIAGDTKFKVLRASRPARTRATNTLD